MFYHPTGRLYVDGSALLDQVYLGSGHRAGGDKGAVLGTDQI